MVVVLQLCLFAPEQRFADFFLCLDSLLNLL